MTERYMVLNQEGKEMTTLLREQFTRENVIVSTENVSLEETSQDLILNINNNILVVTHRQIAELEAILRVLNGKYYKIYKEVEFTK